MEAFIARVPDFPVEELKVLAFSREFGVTTGLILLGSGLPSTTESVAIRVKKYPGGRIEPGAMDRFEMGSGAQKKL
jgi:hypothetical protein